MPLSQFRWRGQYPRAPLPATDGTPQGLAERLAKARRDRARTRKTTARGLQLSFMMALLVGWLLTNPAQTALPSEDQCEDIGLPVGPAAANRMRAAAGLPRAPNAPQKGVSITVCDANLAAMLQSPAVRAQLEEMKGLRSEVAGLFGKAGNDVSIVSIWKEMVASGSADR